MTLGSVVFTICEFAHRVWSEEQQRWKITGVPGALKETQEYPVGFGRALVQPCADQINCKTQLCIFFAFIAPHTGTTVPKAWATTTSGGIS